MINITAMFQMFKMKVKTKNYFNIVQDQNILFKLSTVQPI